MEGPVMELIASYFNSPYVRITSNHLRIKPAVDQCHKILESRTAEELRQMAQILDEIFPEPENIKYKEISHDLTLAFQKRPLPNTLLLPDVSWRELCAILALYLVANDQKKQPRQGIGINAFDTSNIDEDYYSSPWSNALRIGASIFAESPQLAAVINLVNLAENPHTSGLKLGDAKSAAAAIMQENPLRDKSRRRFHRLYVEQGYSNMREAARDFLAIHSQSLDFLCELLKALAPGDAASGKGERAIEALVAYLRSKGIKGKPGRKKAAA
jgi:hypothetical protein